MLLVSHSVPVSILYYIIPNKILITVLVTSLWCGSMCEVSGDPSPGYTVKAMQLLAEMLK